jgi:hypothetical protein
VSAVNEELDRMAAQHGFQVFWLGFLAASNTYEMGIPAVPLGELYSSDSWSRFPNVRVHFRAPVESIQFEGTKVRGIIAGGAPADADAYLSALPFERLSTLAPQLDVQWDAFTHSPITGVHLWFDESVTDLPHGTLLDRTIQWFFNKGEGKYLMLVISASRSLKEMRATFSAAPGLDSKRPPARTRFDNFFLAGDWTLCGWPATMEGAVRSGYLGAEAISGKHFLIPDVA